MEVEPTKKVQNALKTVRIIIALFIKFCKRKRPSSIREREREIPAIVTVKSGPCGMVHRKIQLYFLEIKEFILIDVYFKSISPKTQVI